ncbi:MAG TPA: hypothetical protein VF085_03105 [Solirubrobacterales bacterium]
MSAGAQTSDERDEVEARHQAELDAQREEFHREVSRRAFRIGELEEKVIEVAQTYETSLSWRITRPVRSARTLLAKLRS